MFESILVGLGIGVSHFVQEGIAFFLMMKGAGRESLQKTYKAALAVTLVIIAMLTTVSPRLASYFILSRTLLIW